VSSANRIRAGFYLRAPRNFLPPLRPAAAFIQPSNKRSLIIDPRAAVSPFESEIS